jgi:hypothetical protein
MYLSVEQNEKRRIRESGKRRREKGENGREENMK